MKKGKLRLLLVLVLAICMMCLSSCEALNGAFLLGEDIFDSVIGALDNSPFGSIYDLLNIEGLITGENGGNFEDNDGDSENNGPRVESISVDASGAKTVFDFAEEFTAEGIKIIATMSDGTTKEISLSDVKIKAPDTTSPGTRGVTVIYQGRSTRYEVQINTKTYPAISRDSLADIAENASGTYRVEAELIDMITPGAVCPEGASGFVASAPAGADITGGGKYLTNFGVSWNYFGFTFTSAAACENATIVLRVANPTDEDVNAGVVKMYLNLVQAEDGSVSGEIPLDGYIIKADGACKWADIVIRNVHIPAGTSTLTFEVQGKDSAFDIDYIDLYVGTSYINSVVEIKNTDRVIVDLEALDTEKAFTRSDVAEAHNLKDGQLFVEPVKKEWPGLTTNGGTSVGAVGKGSLISTTIRLAEDATIRIWFKASKTTATNTIYYVDDNWSFYVDGVKLCFVDYIDIHGGDKAQEMYWEWKYTSLGEINLPAGDHTFVIEAVGVDCNVDTVEFEVLSFGSYDESGKGLDEQKHTCKDLCPTCGKCTTDCTEEGCADKCEGCRPEYDAIFPGEGSVSIEAEDLPLDNLIPESSSVAIETFNGGKGIASIKGGYQTFTIMSKKDVTVDLIVNFAKRAGGSILSYIPAISVNGESITLKNGNLPAGVSGNLYWNLAEITIATIELKADTKYEFKVELKSGNLDKYIFKLSEGGSVEPPKDDADVTVATSGVTKYELENIDCTKCDVITRVDFVNQGVCAQGEVGRGSGRIYGFENGSVFRVYVKVTEACNLKISIAGFADTSKGGNPNLSDYSWRFGDSLITPDEGAAINTNGTVGEATVGSVQITEAGVYVFEFSFGTRTDLDYLAFEVVD
jgi:hypothetical protein